MQQVTPLAKTTEIARPVIAGVMVEVCSSQDDAGMAYRHRRHRIRPGRRAAAIVTPYVLRGVKPAAVG
jgi:hypothetical protein